MSIASAILAVSAAVWPFASESTFDCELESSIATQKLDGEWSVTRGGRPLNSHRYRETRIVFFSDGRLTIDLPEESLHLSGEFSGRYTEDGIVMWSAAEPGYCGVLDSMCLTSAAFLIDGPDSGTLTFSIPTVAKRAADKSLASFQLLYECDRVS